MSGKDNPSDSLLRSALEFTDVHDSVSVTKILEESAAAHIEKIKECHQKIKEGKEPNYSIGGKLIRTEGLKESLMRATDPSTMAHRKNEFLEEEAKHAAETPDIDALSPALLTSFYSLRLIKTRDTKIKMLQVVNYFRAVQRILSLEMKHMVTRERAQGDKDDIIEA